MSIGMSAQSSLIAGAPPNGTRMPILRRAVVDIGSNSVRLVVYEGPARAPLPICNEKALCGLGRGLGDGARLNKEAVKEALQTLTRFRQLIDAYANPPTYVIATAAVRSASDGDEFVRAVEALGFSVRILTGEEEAHYAAEGVLSFSPHAAGLVGDMGGGSLELTQLARSKQDKKISLPLGPLRLMENYGDDIKQVEKAVLKSFEKVSWLKPGQTKTLYAVGGGWRAIARLHMGLRRYPLSVLHHYTLSALEARKICALIEQQSRRSLEELPGIPRRRLDTLPYAGLVMDKLLEYLGVESVQVSAGGVREGMLFSELDEETRAQDPLLMIARFFAERFSPEPDYGTHAIALTDTLFPKESKSRARLRKMICVMMDIGSYFHPDHRGAQAFDMILRAPTVGLSHEERLIAARALYRRYEGRRGASPNDQAIALLSWDDQQYGLILGLALRFASALAPKVPELLDGCHPVSYTHLTLPTIYSV